MSYKVVFGEHSARDLLAVSDSPSSRTYVVLSGKMPKRVVARAAPWKGIRGAALQKAYPQVAANASRLAALSRAHRETGWAVVQITRGTGMGATTVCPMKCAAMMIDADKGVIKARFNSLAQAVQSYGLARPISA